MYSCIFPGQGSQKVGIGIDLFKKYDSAKFLFQSANDILGYDILSIMFEGDEKTLSNTIHAQPAIFILSMVLARVLQNEYDFPLNNFSFIAGHSLGEYSALCASGVLSFEDALKLVHKRACIMSKAPEGKMVAVLGLNIKDIENIISKINSNKDFLCEIANDNADAQTILSCSINCIDIVKEHMKNAGAKCIDLNVSIASHCSLMTSAQQELDKILQEVCFFKPCVPIISNVSAFPQYSADIMKQHLVQQMTNRVRWNETMQFLSQKSSCILEIGPSGVLAKMAKRQYKNIPIVFAECDETLSQFISNFTIEDNNSEINVGNM